MNEGTRRGRWMPVVRSEVEKLNLDQFHYVIAWEGAVEAPGQALLWIKRAREGDEIEIGAELYDSATLRSDGRLLLVTAGAIDEASYMTDEDDADE